MGNVLSRLAQPVSKSANDKWLETLTPVKGEFRALMIGIAVGAIFHESKFGLAWERQNIMVPLQKMFNSKGFETAMTVLGMFADELVSEWSRPVHLIQTILTGPFHQDCPILCRALLVP
jgi:hypothetical protein